MYPISCYNLFMKGGVNLTNSEKYALEIAKDITIAKLSKSAPTHSDKESGEKIGEMFKAIYEKTLDIIKDSTGG